MRISTKGLYSLEAVLCLCLLPGDKYGSIRSVARTTGISEGYLEQLFIPLRKKGILKGVRGSRGGYFPAKPLKNLSVGEVLRAVEGPLEPAACGKQNNACGQEKRCRARILWKELHKAIASCVDGINMADLVKSYKAMDTSDYQI